jgi:hypothetical protein
MAENSKLLNFTFSIDAWKNDEHFFLLIADDIKGGLYFGHGEGIDEELDNDSFFEMMDLYSYAKDFKGNLLLNEKEGEGKDLMELLVNKFPFLNDFKKAVFKYLKDENHGSEVDTRRHKT